MPDAARFGDSIQGTTAGEHSGHASPHPPSAISVEEYAEKMIRVSLERQLNEAAHRNGVVLKAEYGGETVTKSYDEEAWQAKSGEEIMEDINKIVEMVQTAKYLK